MRIGDIIIGILVLGGVMNIFNLMTHDTDMQEYYDNHSSFLNLSNRVSTQFGGNTTYTRFSQSITGQMGGIQNNTDNIQAQLDNTDSATIGIFSVPAAALTALKVVFDVIKLEWINTAFGEIGTMFGFEAGTLNFLKYILLWMVILLFVGAILRWRA